MWGPSLHHLSQMLWMPPLKKDDGRVNSVLVTRDLPKSTGNAIHEHENTNAPFQLTDLSLSVDSDRGEKTTSKRIYLSFCNFKVDKFAMRSRKKTRSKYVIH